MIEIISGCYGPLLKYKRGDKISLSELEEKRLVERKVAKYVHQESDVSELEHNECTSEEDDKEEDFFLSENEIRAMKKSELVEYANKIGVPEFDKQAKNDFMIDAILNFIEENSEEVNE